MKERKREVKYSLRMKKKIKLSRKKKIKLGCYIFYSYI